jgi:hypothetical protein
VLQAEPDPLKMHHRLTPPGKKTDKFSYQRGILCDV